MPTISALPSGAAADTDELPVNQGGTTRKVTIIGVADRKTWANLAGKPATFPPEAHTHAVGDVVSVTDARLLGRSAGSAGAAQEITVGSGLSLAGGALTATGGAGAGMLAVPLVVDGAVVAWTNQTAAQQFFNASHRYVTKVDLAAYTQVRLVVNKQATAGAAAAIIRLRYATAFSTTVGSYLTIGASEVSLAINVQNTILDSGWVNLVAGAIANSIFLALDGTGGDGALDPAFGSIIAYFK